MPVARAYQFTNGTLRISSLSRKRSGTGTAMYSAQMSITDWWLETIRWGRDQSISSPPSTTSRAPAPATSTGAQTCGAMRSRRATGTRRTCSSSTRLHSVAVQSRVKTSCSMFQTPQASCPGDREACTSMFSVEMLMTHRIPGRRALGRRDFAIF